VALATRYLNEPRTTYRSVLRHDQCLIGYPLQPPNLGSDGTETSDGSSQRNGSSQDGQATSQQAKATHGSHHQAVVPASLVWRFVGWLGTLTRSLDKAREMLLQHDPNSLCHRASGSVAPHKAVTEARQHALETARQLLLIMPEWDRCFDCKFFPRFATRTGFD